MFAALGRKQSSIRVIGASGAEVPLKGVLVTKAI